MARAPHNVLVLPFRLPSDGRAEFAIFLRADDDIFWQGVAGGMEDDETPMEAACRELAEETGLAPPADRWVILDSRSSMPAKVFRDWRLWGPSTFVVQEHAFAVDVSGADAIDISQEHSEFRWLDFEAASGLLRYESNRTALWELNERLTRGPA